MFTLGNQKTKSKVILYKLNTDKVETCLPVLKANIESHIRDK